MEGRKILVLIVFMTVLCNVSSDNGASAKRDILEFIFSYQDRNPGGGYNGHQDQNGAYNVNQGLYFASPYGYLSPNTAHHGYPIQNKAFPSDYQSLDSASPPYWYKNLDSASSETTSHVVNIVNLDDLQNMYGTNAQKDAILGYVLGEMTDEVKSFVKSNLCPKCFVEDENNTTTKSSQELEKMEELMTSLLQENSRFILEQTQALLSLNLAEYQEEMEKVIGKKVKKFVTKAFDDILLKLETESRIHEEEEEKEEDDISTTESLEPETKTESLTTTADPVIETTTVEMTTETFTTETSAGDLIIPPTETLPVIAKGIISAEDEEDDGEDDSVEFSRIPQQMPDGYKKPIMVTMNGPISMGGHPHGINIFKRKPKPGVRPRPPKRKPVKPKQFNNKAALNA